MRTALLLFTLFISACDEPSGARFELLDGTIIYCQSVMRVECGYILDYCDDGKRHHCEDVWELE